MSSSVDTIKERLSIVDVISSYLKLERAGANYKAPCPFHNEKTPSFFISPIRGSFYCFGCGAKGDIFTFVEQFEGVDFKGALKTLALRAGVELGTYNKEEQSEKDRLYWLMEAATLFYQQNLSGESKEYLIQRGLEEKTIKDFRIGYAQNEWRNLTEAMREKGFTDTELLSCGLSKRPDDKPQGELYDRFRDRVMFPIADTSGRIIAFSGRLLHDVEGQGKYINSPETPIFKKGSTLYGLDKAKFDIRRRDSAVLVEGQMDLVLSHQAGFTNTIATSGTALGDSILADSSKGLLSGLGSVRGLTNNLVIAFDADKAGLKAAGRAERIALSLGMTVKVARLPKDLDPADVILKEGIDTWKKILSSAEHIVLCYLGVLMDHPLSDHTRMRAVRDKIVPYVALMPSAIERNHFLQEIAKRTGISQEALEEDVRRLMEGQEQDSSKEVTSVKESSRGTRILERLIGVLFWQESLSTSTLDIPKCKERLISILGTEKYTEVLNVSEDRKNEQMFEAELVYENPLRLSLDVSELLDNLEEETLSMRLQEIMSELGTTERSGDPERVTELLKESKEITSRLNTIKSSRFSTN